MKLAATGLATAAALLGAPIVAAPAPPRPSPALAPPPAPRDAGAAVRLVSITWQREHLRRNRLSGPGAVGLLRWPRPGIHLVVRAAAGRPRDGVVRAELHTPSPPVRPARSG